MDEKQWILDNKQHFKLYNFNTFSTQEQGRDGSRILVNGVRNEDQHLEKLSVSPQKHPTKAKQQQRTNPRRTAPATDQVLCIQFIHFKNVSVQSKVTYVPTLKIPNDTTVTEWKMSGKVYRIPIVLEIKGYQSLLKNTKLVFQIYQCVWVNFGLTNSHACIIRNDL